MQKKTITKLLDLPILRWPKCLIIMMTAFIFTSTWSTLSGRFVLPAETCTTHPSTVSAGSVWKTSSGRAGGNGACGKSVDGIPCPSVECLRALRDIRIIKSPSIRKMNDRVEGLWFKLMSTWFAYDFGLDV